MRLFLFFVVTLFFPLEPGLGQSPVLISSDGKFLGNLNDNPYDPNSVANPYGKYGSEYSLDSVNNPSGRHGSEYSLESPKNPVAPGTAPRIYGSDGRYLGRLSKNPYDPDSTGNPDGKYGSEYSLDSISNPSGTYGSEYSSTSASYIYGKGFFDQESSEEKESAPSFFSGIVPASPRLFRASGDDLLALLEQRTNQLLQQKNVLVLERVKNAAKARQQNKLFHGYRGQADGLVNRHKKKLIDLYQEGKVLFIETYSITPEEFAIFPDDIRLMAEHYAQERIARIKKILLKKTSL